MIQEESQNLIKNANKKYKKGEKVHKKIIILPVILAIVVAVVYLCTNEKKSEILEDTNIVNTENIEKQEIQEEKEVLLGTLYIDKINVKAPVKQGSTQEVLESYIGHIEDTANYDGNIGLAAHNRGNEYSYFARINELEKGDEIIYESMYGTKKYKVEISKVILETDWSLLENSNENKITLITCIANRPSQRLCVQALEVKE